ncbi:MAG TPA: GGDEF domain-containing protein [Solirubrobacteraceae bacterium]|nr:GGDEF domain-containing protein [Solirubrobacteraceae bacterium]
MAASDPHQHRDRRLSDGGDAVAPSELDVRLREEIARAERYGTGLSCLLVIVEDLEQMEREHGSALPEQTIEYVAAALRGELRCFDRVARTGAGEVTVLLPGTDGARGEIVARRALERLRAIKLEAAGTRTPLHVAVGLAAWREGLSAHELLALARAALRSVNGSPAATGTPVPAAKAPPARQTPATAWSPERTS